MTSADVLNSLYYSIKYPEAMHNDRNIQFTYIILDR